MLGGVGPWELLIILAIVVVMFGAKRLPLIGDGLGKMITNFRRATKANTLEEDTATRTPLNNVPETNDVKPGANP